MLRLKIAGNWEPEDFIEVLKGTESLYYKAVSRRRFPYDPPYFWFERRGFAESFDDNLDYGNDWLLARARAVVRGDTRLRIVRIEYASPGGIDLVGLGDACKAIEGIVDRLIKFFTERRLRKAADERAAIQTEREWESLRAIKIENARAILNLLRDYPEAPVEQLTALIGRDQDKLIPRIAERKLIGVSTSDDTISKDGEST